MRKFIFLVNGTSENWPGIRANRFAKPIRNFYSVSIYYKTSNKLYAMVNFIKIIIKEKPHFLYLMQPGYINSTAGIISKTLFKTKIIIDTGDISYEVAKLTGSRSYLEIIFIKNMEKLLLKMSDLIFVRGIYHKKYLNCLGYNNAYFIPDGVDTETITTMDETLELRKKLNLENYFTIGIIGTINWSKKLQMCYGWEILETVKIMNNLRVKGIIIGDGSGLYKLKEKAKEYGIHDKILFTGNIDYKGLAKYLNLIDVCISTQTNNIVGWTRTTGKLPIYLAHNRYILATKVGSATTILPEEMLVPYHGIKDPHYPEELAQRIRKLYYTPALLKLRENGHKIAKEHFEYSELAKKIATIIQNTMPV